MAQRLFTLLLVLGLVFLQHPVAFAEDRKTLRELLFEKGVITKDEAAEVQETKLAKWIDRITLSGDFRLRHESFWKDPGLDRHRERFRLRVGPEIKIQDFTVGIRLASGTGEQVSTNQSFDNLSSQKAIWIDRAYLRWQGSNSRWLALSGGRMPNPFFRVYSTDAVWDEDFNPEGFAENLNFNPGDTVALFLNAGQIVLHEDKLDNNDQWLFGEQVGVSIEPKTGVKATFAAAYYDFTNTNKSNFGQVACQSGNTRAVPCSGSPDPGRLLNDYNVLDVTALIGMKAGTIPVSLMADYVKNLADPKNVAGMDGGDSGYQAGLILGKASDPHTWELAYFYKILQTDATVADLADSDFGDGGTDRRGHIVWGAYNLTNYLQFKTKFSSTKRESQTGDPSTKDDIDRLQVDVVVKF